MHAQSRAALPVQQLQISTEGYVDLVGESLNVEYSGLQGINLGIKGAKMLSQLLDMFLSTV